MTGRAPLPQRFGPGLLPVGLAYKEAMSTPSDAPVDLLDLKLLPAWVKDPGPERYAEYTGDGGEQTPAGREPRGERDRRPGRRRGDSGRDRRGPHLGRTERGQEQRREDSRSRPGSTQERENRGRPSRGVPQKGRPPRGKGDQVSRQHEDRQQVWQTIARQITIRFLPHRRVLDNVLVQIKSNTLAYSIFSLARLFLEKPERYDVGLSAVGVSSLFRLGENGVLSTDRGFLEQNAFRLAHRDFYNVEVAKTDPIKGNFSSVARCRLSGVLLGPTNHHGYQPKLRSLFEQRFSRRMSFSDYQRQIETVNDPAVLEQWKEEARTVTKYSTLREATPLAFANAAEAERHFRQHYLPGLIQSVDQTIIDGLTSRQMADRVLRRLIEDAWSREMRSPSQMMHELANEFRAAALHIFRQRRGMLFVSPIRVRAFSHDQTSVSPQVKAILETLNATPGASRKELADKLLGGVAGDELDSRKLGLASDLHWLVSEGYVIEFNDGSLDLPRAKASKPEDSHLPQVQPELSGSAAPEASGGEALAAAPLQGSEPLERADTCQSQPILPAENATG